MPAPLKPRIPPPRNRKGPAVVTDEQIHSRARGALLGLAVGDALGTTLEFKKLQSAQFPQLNQGFHTDVTGGGPFAVKRGQVTDDTQMAVCLATSLLTHRRYDLVETAKEYARWMPHAFDIGTLTQAALTLLTEGKHPEFSGRRAWIDAHQKAAGNGSLMRCAPIGVFFHQDQAARINASLEDAAITHFDPQCQLAGVILNAVIAAAIDCPKERLEQADALKVIEAELSIAAAQLGRTHPDFVTKISDAAEWLRADVKAAREDDPMLYGPDLHLHQQAGYVRVCLRLALWELWHAPTFEAALVDVVNRGGDADTNGAVTGALFGAVAGAAAIPVRWSEPVLEVTGAGPLFHKYHPRELLALAEHLPPRAAPVGK